MNSAAKQRYKADGITKIRWLIGMEDGKECEICKSRANKVWHIDTAPPMPAHPRCRCCWAGVVELPGEYVPCDGEGESAQEAQKVKEPRTVKEAKAPEEKLRLQNTSESAMIDDRHREMATEDGDSVNFICKIDRKIYSCVTNDIATDDVVLSEERIDHIKERHPNDFERYFGYIARIIQEPDYILGDKPDTALILKEFIEDGVKFRLVLRLKTSHDNPKYKNSIITFMKTSEKKWNQNLKNKKVLYKKMK